MRKLQLLWIVVLASMVLAACGGAATPAPTEAPSSGGGMPDLGGKTITVAVENAYPPFNSIDEASGQPVGWDYDTVAEICKRINCTPEFKEAAWDGIFPAMQAGEYDMLADGVTVTEDRAKIIDYSTSYVTIGQVLLIKSDQTIDDVEAFKANPDVVVATQIGTTNEIVAKDNFGDRVKSFEEFGGAVAALLSGDVDAVVIDTVSAVGFIADNPGKLKIGPTLTSDEQLAFVFPPGSDLTASVDAALASMQADGTLKQLNDKWFNP
jgi:polar amino acid transport system substrate-binding protein